MRKFNLWNLNVVFSNFQTRLNIVYWYIIFNYIIPRKIIQSYVFGTIQWVVLYRQRLIWNNYYETRTVAAPTRITGHRVHRYEFSRDDWHVSIIHVTSTFLHKTISQLRIITNTITSINDNYIRARHSRKSKRGQSSPIRETANYRIVQSIDLARRVLSFETTECP